MPCKGCPCIANLVQAYIQPWHSLSWESGLPQASGRWGQATRPHKTCQREPVIPPHLLLKALSQLLQFSVVVFLYCICLRLLMLTHIFLHICQHMQTLFQLLFCPAYTCATGKRNVETSVTCKKQREDTAAVQQYHTLWAASSAAGHGHLCLAQGGLTM